MRCGTVRKLLVPLLLGELEGRKGEVEAHLEECPRCSRDLVRLSRLISAVEGSLGRVPEAARLVEGVMETVRQVSPTPALRRREVPPIPLTAEEAERRIRQRSTAQLLLAALVAGAMLVLWAVMPKGRGAAPASSPAPATEPAQRDPGHVPLRSERQRRAKTPQWNHWGEDGPKNLTPAQRDVERRRK